MGDPIFTNKKRKVKGAIFFLTIIDRYEKNTFGKFGGRQ